MDKIRKHLLEEGAVDKECLVFLIKTATKILKSEPNLLKVKEPVIIIGDIHGQYFDMIHMFEKVVDPRGLP